MSELVVSLFNYLLLWLVGWCVVPGTPLHFDQKYHAVQCCKNNSLNLVFTWLVSPTETGKSLFPHAKCPNVYSIAQFINDQLTYFHFNAGFIKLTCSLHSYHKHRRFHSLFGYIFFSDMLIFINISRSKMRKYFTEKYGGQHQRQAAHNNNIPTKPANK